MPSLIIYKSSADHDLQLLCIPESSLHFRHRMPVNARALHVYISQYIAHMHTSAELREIHAVCVRFKLCLAEGYNDSMGACRLPAGLTPVRVIADYLRYLKEFTLSKLSIQWGSKSITAENVMWALTIPAAWTETAEQSMRQAAVSAGIVSHPGSRYVFNGRVIQLHLDACARPSLVRLAT